MRPWVQALALGLSLAPAGLAWAGSDAFWSEEWPGNDASLVVLQAAVWVALAGMPVAQGKSAHRAPGSQRQTLAWTDVLLALPGLAVGASFDRERGLGFQSWFPAAVALGMAACFSSAAAREGRDNGRRAQVLWLCMVVAPAAFGAALWIAWPAGNFGALWHWLQVSPVVWTVAQTKAPVAWWSLAAPAAVCALHWGLSSSRAKRTGA